MRTLIRSLHAKAVQPFLSLASAKLRNVLEMLFMMTSSPPDDRGEDVSDKLHMQSQAPTRTTGNPQIHRK